MPETLQRLRDLRIFVDQPAELVADVVAAGIVPSLLEIMDATTIRAASSYLRADLPEDCAAMLLWQCDAAGDVARAEVSAIGELARRHRATDVVEADDPAEADLLMAARRCVLMALDTLGTTLIDDVCVPRTRLGDLIEGVERIAERHGLVIGVVGHAGDGNMHPTVVFDAADPAATRRARQSFGEVMDLGLELGGTITGSGCSSGSGWPGRSVRCPCRCTARSSGRSTRPGCSTPGRSSTRPAARFPTWFPTWFPRCFPTWADDRRRSRAG